MPKETEYLKIPMVDPETDGNEYFNIEEIINKPITIFDGNAKSVNDRLSAVESSEYVTLGPSQDSVIHMPEEVVNGKTKLSVKGRTRSNLVPKFPTWKTVSGVWTDTADYITQLEITDNTNKLRSILINVKPNTTYTLRIEHNGNIAVFNEAVTTPLVDYTSNQTATFNTGTNDKLVIYIRNINATNGTYIFKYPILEEGTAAGSFIVGTQSVDGLLIKNVGKNLFDRSKAQRGYELSTVGVPTKNTNYFVTDFVEVDISKPYIKNNNNRFYWFDSNKNFVSRTNATTLHEIPPINAKYMRTEGLLSIIDTIQLEEGVASTEYEPYTENSVLIPEPLYSLPNGVYDEIREGKNGLEKVKRIEKVLLDGTLNWQFAINYVGYKRVKINNGILNVKDFTDVVVKYDGKLLERDTSSPTFEKADKSYLDSANFNLTLANSDTGWGDSYTPTVDEIKAYYMGWRMFENVIGFPPYNGTGQKMWGKIYVGQGTNNNGIISGSAISTVPTTLNDMSYIPYQLYYKLATEEVIDIKVPSPIVEENGTMYIENWKKYVLKEEDIETISNTPVNLTLVNVPTRVLTGAIKFINYDIQNIRILGKSQVKLYSDNVNLVGAYYTDTTGYIRFLLT